MHAFAAVVVPAGVTRADAEPYVEKAMAPFYEENPEGGWWDWYQIGGRFTGVWSEYDPAQDPANVEMCSQCAGTGTRPGGLEQFGQEWFDACHGCNGCHGTGKAVRWPTQWGPHDGDVIDVKALLHNPLKVPSTVVTPTDVLDGGWQNLDGDAEWRERVVEALTAYADQRLVVVDYHS